MASRIISLCIDCREAEQLAAFWAEALGWEVTDRGWQLTDHGGDGVSIGTPGGGFEIDFRWVPEGAKHGKNRLHLDLRHTEGNQAAELQRLIGLGATPVDVGQGHPTWHVLADPEGNEFCLCREQVEL